MKQFLPTKVPCYKGEIEWPPHAVVTMHVTNEFVPTDATQFYWLTTQFVIAELFLRLNKELVFQDSKINNFYSIISKINYFYLFIAIIFVEIIFPVTLIVKLSKN